MTDSSWGRSIPGLERGIAQARFFWRRGRAFLGRGYLQQRTRVVVHDTEDTCTTPIIVVGAHRSGTSLLRRVLDSHSNIACPPESHFLVHYLAVLKDERSLKGLEGMGFDRAAVRMGVRRGATYFHEAYRRAKGKARWADKTPNYAPHLRALADLLGPDTQYVMIFRHPMDVSFSLWKRGWELGDGRREGEDLLDATCRYVVESLDQLLDFRVALPQTAYHTLYYDHLVDEPEEVLRGLCNFLREPWDANMLTHHRTPHDFGTEDPVARGTEGFRGSFMNWKAWSPEQQRRAWNILKAHATALGYQLDSAHRD